MIVEYPGLITFELTKDGDDRVKFQVLEQNPEIRGGGVFHGTIHSLPNGFYLGCDSNPELFSNCVYIRGRMTSKDDVVSSIKYGNLKSRDMYFDNVRTLFDAWSKSPAVAHLLKVPVVLSPQMELFE